ncbi:Excinuclease ABC subunit B [hydrothermal vent metagenome]|uniref:UvrABC system protein B n=1 Tax=hydrothermal vent metagenome TaxID=652676 RepID=A0A3B1D9H4_9ZZZZ
MAKKFKLRAGFEPAGDQPGAIKELVKGLESGVKSQVLLGVTGSGKTFTIASVIEKVQKPTLVIAHNKTLAAQLYSEFKTFFPENAVEYFVSYYDYYQPEAFLPQSGTYIEKDASINDEIDKMRHSATMSLLERRDVIIVASVSCIYGLGSPETYNNMKTHLETGMTLERDQLLESLVTNQYERNNIDFKRGTFRVNGDVVEILPIYTEDDAIRVEFFGDEVESISRVDSLTGKVWEKLPSINIYPGSHYVTRKDTMQTAIATIREEALETSAMFHAENKLIEAQRIEERTFADIEMIKAIGYCKGIENYSRYLSGRSPGSPPPTLMEYMARDSLIVIDESHQTIPQIGAMFKGDRSRKKTLIDYGFRLPSAYDNRPLNFKEFEELTTQLIYVSATPSDYEVREADGVVVEQVVRPTGLIDPEVIVRPVKNQVDDLLEEIRVRAERDERVLVTAMTKRQAEDLTDHYQSLGANVRYLHSDIATLERISIIQELRKGEFDTLIGINLLREGLDIPEVSLVAILNADMEGFLRSATSLIQTSGRAARNVEGKVIMYADRITGSMKLAMEETMRRRAIQLEYNKKHNITPVSVKKNINEVLSSIFEKDYITAPKEEENLEFLPIARIEQMIKEQEKLMKKAAADLDFERAVTHRDEIKRLKEREMI